MPRYCGLLLTIRTLQHTGPTHPVLVPDNLARFVFQPDQIPLQTE